MNEMTNDELALLLLKDTLTLILAQAETSLRAVANIMRRHEANFSEDAFDELPRIADKLAEYRSNI